MGLHSMFPNSLRQSSRLCSVKRFDAIILAARRSLLCGENNNMTINSKSLALSSNPSRTLSSVSFATNKSLKHILSHPENHQPVLSQACIPKSLRKEYSSDNPGDNGYLVYMGRVHGMFRGIKIFSLTTSALGIMLQPYLFYTLQDVSLFATVPIFAAVNLFVFTNSFLIHFLAKRYVNEQHFNPKTKEFSATTLTFFARKASFTFTADDVTVPEIPGMFSMFSAKGRPLFVDERDFTSMEVYKHLMGFDKPLDLRHVSNPSRQESEND